MKPLPPLSKIEMIERSMRCFDLGLLGLIPLIGIPMAVMSMAQYRRVKRGQGALWNPAQRYLYWGGQCAFVGLLPILIIVVFAAVAVCLQLRL
jgi:hypothetical protein